MIKTKYKKSRQRQRILELLQSTDEHPTADWIFSRLRSEIKNLSLGTVYRNLNLLVEMGLAKKINFGTAFDRFDAVVQNHYHLVCEKCGSVYDLDMKPDEMLVKKAAEKTSFIIREHKIEFFGICKNCQ